MAQRGFRIDITDQLRREQATMLAQWIGSANVIRNQKVEEYLGHLANQQGQAIDQAYKHIRKHPDLLFLKDVPVQVLRNAASAVFSDAEAARKGIRKFPKKKGRSRKRSVVITRELYRLESIGGNETQLTIYSDANQKRRKVFSITLPHASVALSKQFRVSRQGRRFTLSGSYEDNAVYRETNDILSDYAHLSDDELLSYINGIDGGIARPLQASNGEVFDYTPEEKKKLRKLTQRIARLQKVLASKKRLNGNKNTRRCESNSQRHLANTIASLQHKIANIRLSFAHRVSFRVVEMSGSIISVEDLKLKAMTKKAKPKRQARGYLKNSARAKSGLNRSLLNVGLGRIYTFIDYKANERGKALVKVPAAYSSRTCHACGSRKTLRPSQAIFQCLDCNITLNADENAAKVIAQRGVKVIKEDTFAQKAKPRKTVVRRRKPKAVATPPLVEELTSGKKSEALEDVGELPLNHSRFSSEKPGIRPSNEGSPYTNGAFKTKVKPETQV